MSDSKISWLPNGICGPTPGSVGALPLTAASRIEGDALEKRSCMWRCAISQDTGSRGVLFDRFDVAGLCKKATRVLDSGVYGRDRNKLADSK